MLVKNRRKKVRKRFFISHEYRELKMGGRNARNNFSRNTRIVRSKNFGQKIVGKKVRKMFFYIHTNTVKKNGWEKKARNNFSRNTRIVRAKNVGEKIFGKKCEKRFFYSHEFRDQKMGGENARNSFSRNTLIVRT